MLDVTGGAETRVYLLPVDGHSRPAEEFSRMAVVGGFERVLVALPAGLVHRSLRRRRVGESGRCVTSLAGRLYLVVGVGRGADERHSPVAAQNHPVRDRGDRDRASRRVEDPENRLPRHARPLNTDRR